MTDHNNPVELMYVTKLQFSKHNKKKSCTLPIFCYLGNGFDVVQQSVRERWR